jgi:hypothetical protein
MKRLLVILMLFPLFVSAQWHCDNEISFGPNDTLNPYMGWHHAIAIDTINFHHNIWQVGKPHKDSFTAGWPFPNVVVTDTLNPYPPNDTSVFTLEMPSKVYVAPMWYNLFEITFVYRLELDSGTIARVEISEDGGLHWINVIDSLPFGFGWNGMPPILASSTTGWMNFSLNACGLCVADSNVLFRFTFISDSTTSLKDGWMIDNIMIGYWCEASVSEIKNVESINIYPNPATSSITISAPNKITTISITNVLGQNVYSKQCNSPQVEIDVAALPAGVYIVKVNGTEVRKFVKQ